MITWGPDTQTSKKADLMEHSALAYSEADNFRHFIELRNRSAKQKYQGEPPKIHFSPPNEPSSNHGI
jgi:hypothetical protein